MKFLDLLNQYLKGESSLDIEIGNQGGTAAAPASRASSLSSLSSPQNINNGERNHTMAENCARKYWLLALPRPGRDEPITIIMMNPAGLTRKQAETLAKTKWPQAELID